MSTTSDPSVSPSPPSSTGGGGWLRSKPLLVVIGTLGVAAVLVLVLVYGGISGISLNASSPQSEHAVTFQESGLLSGQSWQVTLAPYMIHGAGATVNSTSPTIQFLEPNGNYVFVISSAPAYFVVPKTGEVSVVGSDVSVPVTFTVGSLGTVFAWGIPSNDSGTESPGCGPAATTYCYSITIAGANGVSTSNVGLSLRDAFGATVAWSLQDTVSLFSPTNASAVATYDPSTTTWTLVPPFTGQLASGETIVIATPATATAGLLGIELVAIGMNGYSGTVASNAFS